MDGIIEDIPVAGMIAAILVLLALIVIYYVLLVRSILEMLRRNVEQNALLTFAFLSLIFSPFTLIMGINVMIIWRFYKRDLSL